MKTLTVAVIAFAGGVFVTLWKVADIAAPVASNPVVKTVYCQGGNILDQLKSQEQ